MVADVPFLYDRIKRTVVSVLLLISRDRIVVCSEVYCLFNRILSHSSLLSSSLASFLPSLHRDERGPRAFFRHPRLYLASTQPPTYVRYFLLSLKKYLLLQYFSSDLWSFSVTCA